MLSYMVTPLRKYATFRGRAQRAEFWWFKLLTLLLVSIALFIDFRTGHGPFANVALGAHGGKLTMAAIGPVYAVVVLLLALPSFAVAVRRLHDINRSGWYWLLAFIPVVGAVILLFWFLKRGTAGGNDYGSDPKA
jgi:uncharacterized membrane protein YhaH (DUF805 family)